jgi:poly(hydroxyalkanoate) granule-associated protein
MVRTTPRSRRIRKAPAPAVSPARAFRTLRASAEKALHAGVQAATGVRESAVGAFDALVKQGAAIESRSRHAAMARAEKARDAAVARAQMARTKTVEAVTHLERVFERRVSRAISKLGVPTSGDIRALSRQVAQLQANVEKLHRVRTRVAR